MKRKNPKSLQIYLFKQYKRRYHSIGLVLGIQFRVRGHISICPRPIVKGIFKCYSPGCFYYNPFTIPECVFILRNRVQQHASDLLKTVLLLEASRQAARLKPIHVAAKSKTTQAMRIIRRVRITDRDGEGCSFRM